MAQMISPWSQVQLARHSARPRAGDYIRGLCEDYIELHGNDCCEDDPLVIGGVGTFAGQTVVMIGHQRSATVREHARLEYGPPRLEDCRKALQLLLQAEKYKFPVISFIDAPAGALPDQAAESAQTSTLAEYVMTITGLRTPIISCVVGEGGSADPLALGIADRLLLLEHAIYAVASPEAYAIFRWHDSNRAPEAALALRLTAEDLLELGIADGIVPEPEQGAHSDPTAIIASVGDHIRIQLNLLRGVDLGRLLEHRYLRYRAISRYQERLSLGPQSDQPGTG
jgi:acetyl-CoA carboxylase carboxyl transferase subunit alpha